MTQLLCKYRETLLGQLGVYIKQTRDEFESMVAGQEAAPKQKNFPNSVNQISWVRGLEHKVGCN